MTNFIPYCGSPPVPRHVFWNADPILGSCLLAALAVALQLKAVASASRTDRACLLAGWLVLALAWMSPLCNLSVALCSARAAQHILIALIAAPLLALSGLPGAVAGAFRRSVGLPAEKANPFTGLLHPGPFIFALVFWFWHFGAPYDLTLQNNFVYWTMQLSIILSSIGLWAALLNKRALANLQFVAGSVFTGLQMSLLGALLTLSGTPWFSVHESTTWPWGLTPLDDLQLGGALMWVAGGIILAGFLLYGFARFFSALDMQEARGPSA